MTAGEQRELHELSYELGRNAKGLEDLNKLFEQHCKDDDRRHEENVALLKANTDAIAAQSKALEKFNARVALMNPGSSVLSRKQVAVWPSSVRASSSWWVGWSRPPSNGQSAGSSARS
jgi:hypothetical protein